MRSFSWPGLLATAAMLALTPPLRAQAMNYAELQDMLGEPATTSVIGKPQRASDVPASVTIITRDEIARSPARNVPDLLKSYAGVEVNRWTAGQSDVAVRGGVQTYNARLLVLVNGRQVYLDHYGETDWNLLGIQLDEIQQIELVRGPAGALFGFNAAAGVVNIITIDPLAGRHAAVTAEAGDHGQARVNGTVAWPLTPNIGLTLSGGHEQQDERAVPSFLYHPARINSVRVDQAGARVSVTPDPATRVDLEGNWSFNRQLEFLPSQLLSEQRYRAETVGVVVNHDTGWGSVTGRAYTNWLDATYGVTTAPTDPLYAISAAAVSNRITVAQASTLVRLDDSDTLRVGVEFRDNQLFSRDAFSAHVGYRNGAASAMLDLHPTERLAVSLAARVDRLWLGQGGAILRPAANLPRDFDRTLTQPSINIGTVLQVGAAGQLRVNGGRGLQSPSLAAFGLRVAVTSALSPLPLLVAGDPTLSPAISWSGEIGYSQRVGQALRLDGSLFGTRTGHVIASPGSAATLSPVALPTPVLVTRFGNIGSFATYGIQAGASGRVTGGFASGLAWRLNYSWTQVMQHLPINGGDLGYAFSPRATTPAHVANLSLDYARARWSVAIDGHLMAATRQFAFDRTGTMQLVPVPRALALDAKIGRTLTKRLSAYVAGDNLGRARGASGSPIPADRRIRAGLRLAV